MTESHPGRYFEVHVDANARIVTLSRTSVALDHNELDELAQELARLKTFLQQIDRSSFGLLVDSRQAPRATTPAVAAAAFNAYVEAADGFFCVAAVLKTEGGRDLLKRKQSRVKQPGSAPL